MRGGMRHKAVLVLGFALLALVVACGDTQPLPDIDATVEARVALAKASLVAPTAAPLPTYTPMPTYTPAPALAPEVRDAVVCVPVITGVWEAGVPDHEADDNCSNE